jgi:hypothetical protein
MNKGLERKLEHYPQPKVFECFWGAGYRGDDNKSIMTYHLDDFFSENCGYEQNDITDILEMEINEIVNLDGIDGQHWVRRIK